MMSIRKLLGIKTAAEKEREKEMNYRMNVRKKRKGRCNSGQPDPALHRYP